MKSGDTPEDSKTQENAWGKVNDLVYYNNQNLAG
jgi:hypothetical protein